MKQGVLILIIFLLLVSCVSALNVELIGPPEEAYFVDSNDIDFKCKATIPESDSLIQLILYTNLEGTMQPTGNSISNPLDNTIYTFTILNIDNGEDYIWNCRAISLEDNKFAISDWPFRVNFQNNPPTFTDPIPNQSWSQDTSLDSAFDLDTYFTDTDPITYSISGNSNIFVSIASDGQVSFSQPTGWWGTEEVTFRASDSAGYTDSNQVTLTVTQGTSSCTEDWDCTSWSDCEYDEETRTCTDDNNCGTTNDKPSESRSCNGCIEDWDCTSWSDCEDGHKTRDCTDEYDCGTTDDKPDETKSCSPISTRNEYTIDITESSPQYSTVRLKPGQSQDFTITTNTDVISWKIDNVKISEDSKSFTYKPTLADIGEHEIEVLAGSSSDGDGKEWKVIVEEELKDLNLCGNNKVDVNETCLNCPQDVPCQEGEYCNGGVCKTKKVNTITGFFTKSKNFAVQKWYYPTLILSIIILLIIIIKISRLHKKPKKDDYLGEFKEEKTFFQRLRKRLKHWDKKRQLKKQNKETLKRLKIEKDDNIKVTAPGIESIMAFVNQKLSEGSPKRNIKKALKQKGWNRRQIKQAFKKIKNDSRKPTQGNQSLSR